MIRGLLERRSNVKYWPHMVQPNREAAVVAAAAAAVLQVQRHPLL